MLDLKKEIEAIYEQVVAWRRDFHMYPELGNHEKRTAKIVAEHLKGLGIEVFEGVGGCGVIGLIKGGNVGKVIALRADMDALPIQEGNTFEYSSKIPGVMHACGHDGNTAMLMGTASILSKMRTNLKGSVKFIFQPAEEGGGGAKKMILDGALENPRPDAIIATHLVSFDSGTITIRKGISHTASDSFKLEVYGNGGHGAKPHESTDTLLAACQIVNALQMIVSRKVSPQETATVTVGKIHSGTAVNIIPEYAVLEGTVRTINPEVQDVVIKGINDIAEGICKAIGTTYKLTYEKNYSVVYNDYNVMDTIQRACEKYFDQKNLRIADLPRPGSEDFSEYTKSGIPGGYFWLGGAYLGQEPSKNHQPTYDWDENTMKAGMLAEVATVLEYLS
jgi:amidohydrolase